MAEEAMRVATVSAIGKLLPVVPPLMLATQKGALLAFIKVNS